MGIYASLAVCRTVSTDAMQILFGAPPLDLVVLKAAAVYKIKKGKEMTQLDLISNEEVSRMSMTECKALMDDRIINRWQEKWCNTDKGRATYRFIQDVTFAQARPDFKPNIYALFILTGHGSLNEFLHKRNLSDTPACDCGHAVEDWLHVLTECPLYAHFRDLNAMKITCEQGGMNVGRVLETKESYLALCTFANNTFACRRARAQPRAIDRT